MATRSLKDARAAFERGDHDALKVAHSVSPHPASATVGAESPPPIALDEMQGVQEKAKSPSAVEGGGSRGNATAMTAAEKAKQNAHENHSSSGWAVKSMVYGGLDGLVTTFAIVAGVYGSALATKVAIILGFANLFADALSMGVGDYISSQAEDVYGKRERRREAWEVDNFLEGEKQEMIEIYMKKGLPLDDATHIIDIMSKHRDFFIDVMMVEELGILSEDGTVPAWKTAFVTFASFIVFGAFPLIVYAIAAGVGVLDAGILFAISASITAVTLFMLGVVKSRFTGEKWYGSGLKMLMNGALASVAAYGIGFIVEFLIL